MPYSLTGNKISLTYNRLVQTVSGSLFDGVGNPIHITASLSGSFSGSFSGRVNNGYPFLQKGNTFSEVSASLGTNDNKSLSFKTNNTPRLFISSSGNVGIGTRTPDMSLQVVSALTSSVGYARIGASSGTAGHSGLIIDRVGTGGFFSELILANAGATKGRLWNANENIFRIDTATGVDLTLQTGATERVRILSTGAIGIGTTVPGSFGLAINHATGQCLDLIYNDSDGSPSTHCPIVISSAGNLSISPTGALINVSSSISPSTDNTYKLGSTLKRFSDVFAVQTTIGALFETGLRTDKLSELPTGTIVCWKSNKCVPCTKENDKLVMGVVKNGKDEPIILGAEPILITGEIEEGDYIVTSNKLGHGMKANEKLKLFGKVIAQALENGDGDSYTIKAIIRKL